MNKDKVLKWTAESYRVVSFLEKELSDKENYSIKDLKHLARDYAYDTITRLDEYDRIKLFQKIDVGYILKNYKDCSTLKRIIEMVLEDFLIDEYLTIMKEIEWVKGESNEF